jgi:hypothetical protein
VLFQKLSIISPLEKVAACPFNSPAGRAENGRNNLQDLSALFPTSGGSAALEEKAKLD